MLTLCKPTHNMSVESGGKTRDVVVKGYICLHKQTNYVTRGVEKLTGIMYPVFALPAGIFIRGLTFFLNCVKFFW